MNALITQLPKAELHLHIEGSLEPELMFELAERNRIQLPYADLSAVKKAYQFSDLQSFLDIYYQSAAVLIHEQDFYDLTWAYLLKCQQQNVVHTEIFFDPQTHTQRGIAIETVMAGITHALRDAKAQLGISSQLIFCILRDLSAQAADETLTQLLPFKEQLLGIGLDSAEVGHPPEKFQQVFARARAEGFITVAHAGEEGGADYIWQALELLQVARIDHGIRSIDDDNLLQHLAKTRTPLTVCPLSNVCLHAVESINTHPIKTLLDKGLCVTVNSDDPAYFGGYVNENYAAIQQAFALSDQQLAQLAMHSFEASFMDENRKQMFIENIKQLVNL